MNKKLLLFSMMLCLCITVSISNQTGLNPVKAASPEQAQESRIEELLLEATADPLPNPVVSAARGNDYHQVTLEAIEKIGGLADIIEQGDHVLIKPNICTLAAAGSPTITDYRTVEAIAELAKKLGAAKIVIGEGTISGNAFGKIFLRTNKYDLIEGVELINFNSFSRDECYLLKPHKSLTGAEFYIPKVFMDADVVINVAKLKTHSQPEAVVSLTLKNSFGIPPGSIYGITFKSGLHRLGLKESIIDLNRIRRPDLAIIEGIVGGEGYGPLHNSPVNSNIIFAGKDLVALDTVALTFMGFSVEQVPHVELAGREGLGITDLNKINLIGLDLTKKMSFRR